MTEDKAQQKAERLKQIVAEAENSLTSIQDTQKLVEEGRVSLAQGIEELESSKARVGALTSAAEQQKSAFDESVSSLKAQIEAKLNEVESLRQSSANAEATSKQHAEQAQASTVEIGRLREEADNDRKTTNEHAADASAKAATVREVSTQADGLRATIEGYQAKFSSFDSQLEQREKRLADGEANHKMLMEELKSDKTKISSVIAESERMLTGATTTGLASSFAKVRDDLTEELKAARLAFYLSILFLFISTLPLVGFILPALGLPGIVVGPKPETAWEFVIGVVVRMIILVPTVWAARFSAARHSNLFRLRENYAYKYSLASSVEGFKRQAESHKEEIAAITFMDLAFNPADRMDAKDQSSKAPNPFLQKLMDKFGLNESGTGT
jgi:hypothetical protein